MEIEEVFNETEEITVYNDGVQTTYDRGEEVFNCILGSWKELLSGSHQMPAFGVSLNRETVKEMKTGMWAEFIFDEVHVCNGMPFEKLLVNVNSGFYGFNIIRYNSKHGYDGRCFYIDLVDKDMSKFYNVLIQI